MTDRVISDAFPCARSDASGRDSAPTRQEHIGGRCVIADQHHVAARRQRGIGARYDVSSKADTGHRQIMWAALRVIRQRGYSFDDEEHALATRCVAATVYDEHAEPLGAISLAGPSSRLSNERIRQLGPIVAHTAEELTQKLGGKWPHPY